jgi:hypothetical protein
MAAAALKMIGSRRRRWRDPANSGGLGIRMPALRGGEDVELAGDVDVMGAPREAGIDHLRAGGWQGRQCV